MPYLPGNAPDFLGSWCPSVGPACPRCPWWRPPSHPTGCQSGWSWTCQHAARGKTLADVHIRQNESNPFFGRALLMLARPPWPPSLPTSLGSPSSRSVVRTIWLASPSLPNAWRLPKYSTMRTGLWCPASLLTVWKGVSWKYIFNMTN